MVNVAVCIGSACHVKGSRHVVEQLQYLIAENNVADKVELSGIFCTGNCTNEGIAVTVDDKPYSIKVEDVKDFFKKEIMSRL